MTDQLDDLRRLPIEKAGAVAKGILSFLAYRPDLRKLYSARDIVYLKQAAARATPDEKLRYAKRETIRVSAETRIEDDGDLARMYAGMLNSKLDAGQPVTPGDLDAIAEELDGGEWTVDYSDHTWTARRCREVEQPARYAMGETDTPTAIDAPAPATTSTPVTKPAAPAKVPAPPPPPVDLNAKTKPAKPPALPASPAPARPKWKQSPLPVTDAEGLSTHTPTEEHDMPHREHDAWWYSVPETQHLKHGVETDRGRVGDGMNGAWRASFKGEDGSIQNAVWKESTADRTSQLRPWTIPHGNSHGHEAAAYETAYHLGLADMVPPTVTRFNEGEIGSAQHWRDGLWAAHHSAEPFGPAGGKQFPLAAAFDAAIMNTDRHHKNWLVDPDTSQMTLIDHGLAFPQTYKKHLNGNSAILGEAIKNDTPIPAEVADWAAKWPHVERSLRRNKLTDAQIELMRERVVSLAVSAAKGETFRQWLANSDAGLFYHM
jgi:hypothetical protein